MNMDIDERRAGRERRNVEGFNSEPPFLTRDGLVFTDRRQSAERRQQTVASPDFSEVEEIELQPVRFT